MFRDGAKVVKLPIVGAALLVVLSLATAQIAWGGDSLTTGTQGGPGIRTASVVNADVEPNDTRDQARAIQLGTTYKGGYSGESDKGDWYKVTLPNSGILTIDVSADDCQVSFGTAANPELVTLPYLYASESHSVRVTSGVYYIKCRRPSGYVFPFGEDSTYSFKLTLESAHESFHESLTSNNNGFTKASSIKLGTSYRGQIAMNDADDYYRFSLPSAGRITLSSTAYSTGFEVDFGIYGASQSRLWGKSIEVDSSSLHANGSWSVDLGKGVYYLRASNADAKYGDKHNGTYNFKVAFSSARETIAEAQGGSNNYLYCPSPISLGKTYVSQLAVNDRKDIFKFKTTGSGVVRIDANSSLSGVSWAITNVYGDSIASKWSSGDMSWTCDCGKGTHYLSASSSSTGPIRFSVKELTSIKKAKVGKIKAKTYTGKKIMPKLKVTLGGKKLRLYHDYTVKFSQNKNAGRAKVTIIGTGDYTGKKTATFKIEKAKQKVEIKGRTWKANSRYTLDYWEPVSAERSYSATVKSAHGKVAYQKVRANKLNEQFTVKSNGTVTVKAGTPEGTYKLKIKARARGNRNYKPGSATFTTTIKVKYW